MLTPDKTRYENGVRIHEKIIPDSARATKYVASWVAKGDKMKPGYSMNPIGITLHNTGDLTNVNDDAEQYTRATWPNCNMGGVVVHYYIDDLGAWQNLRENESGWHASDGQGNGNRRTIAIECIMSGTTGAQNIKAKDNAARLIASIMYRYKWNINNLYTHNHWKGQPDRIVSGASKNCPIYILPDYDGFKALVQKYLNNLNGSEEKVETSVKPDNFTSSSTNYDSISVGDIMNFTGNYQYISSISSARSSSAKPCKVKVTKKTLRTLAHPIHVRSIDDNENFISGIYGWVDLKDLNVIIKVPFTVRVITNSLDYRKGPSNSYDITGTIKDKGIYTIVEVRDGWGKLKSGAGWINLSYTKKI